MVTPYVDPDSGKTYMHSEEVTGQTFEEFVAEGRGTPVPDPVVESAVAQREEQKEEVLAKARTAQAAGEDTVKHALAVDALNREIVALQGGVTRGPRGEVLPTPPSAQERAFEKVEAVPEAKVEKGYLLPTLLDSGVSERDLRLAGFKAEDVQKAEKDKEQAGAAVAQREEQKEEVLAKARTAQAAGEDTVKHELAVDALNREIVALQGGVTRGPRGEVLPTPPSAQERAFEKVEAVREAKTEEGYLLPTLLDAGVSERDLRLAGFKPEDVQAAEAQVTAPKTLGDDFPMPGVESAAVLEPTEGRPVEPRQAVPIVRSGESAQDISPAANEERHRAVQLLQAVGRASQAPGGQSWVISYPTEYMSPYLEMLYKSAGLTHDEITAAKTAIEDHRTARTEWQTKERALLELNSVGLAAPTGAETWNIEFPKHLTEFSPRLYDLYIQAGVDREDLDDLITATAEQAAVKLGADKSFLGRVRLEKQGLAKPTGRVFSGEWEIMFPTDRLITGALREDYTAAGISPSDIDLFNREQRDILSGVASEEVGAGGIAPVTAHPATAAAAERAAGAVAGTRPDLATTITAGAPIVVSEAIAAGASPTDLLVLQYPEKDVRDGTTTAAALQTISPYSSDPGEYLIGDGIAKGVPYQTWIEAGFTPDAIRDSLPAAVTAGATSDMLEGSGYPADAVRDAIATVQAPAATPRPVPRPGEEFAVPEALQKDLQDAKRATETVAFTSEMGVLSPALQQAPLQYAIIQSAVEAVKTGDLTADEAAAVTADIKGAGLTRDIPPRELAALAPIVGSYISFQDAQAKGWDPLSTGFFVGSVAMDTLIFASPITRAGTAGLRFAVVRPSVALAKTGAKIVTALPAKLATASARTTALGKQVVLGPSALLTGIPTGGMGALRVGQQAPKTITLRGQPLPDLLGKAVIKVRVAEPSRPFTLPPRAPTFPSLPPHKLIEIPKPAPKLPSIPKERPTLAPKPRSPKTPVERAHEARLVQEAQRRSDREALMAQEAQRRQAREAQLEASLQRETDRRIPLGVTAPVRRIPLGVVATAAVRPVARDVGGATDIPKAPPADAPAPGGAPDRPDPRVDPRADPITLDDPLMPPAPMTIPGPGPAPLPGDLTRPVGVPSVTGVQPAIGAVPDVTMGPIGVQPAIGAVPDVTMGPIGLPQQAESIQQHTTTLLPVAPPSVQSQLGPLLAGISETIKQHNQSPTRSNTDALTQITRDLQMAVQQAYIAHPHLANIVQPSIDTEVQLAAQRAVAFDPRSQLRVTTGVIPADAPVIRTQPVSRIRTQPVSRIRTEPVSRIRTEPVSRIRTQPVSRIRTEPVTKIPPPKTPPPKTPPPPPPRAPFAPKPRVGFRLPDGKELPAGWYPHIVQWPQGNALITRDLQTGQTTYTGRKTDGTTARKGFKVLKMSRRRPVGGDLDIGAFLAQSEDILAFRPDPTNKDQRFRARRGRP